MRNRVFGKVVTRPATGKMKFCKRCHKRVVEVAFASKDFTNVCLCGDDYLRVVEGSEAEGFLEVLATPHNRKAKRRILPMELPHTES